MKHGELWTILQAISDPLFVKDQNHRYAFVNRAFAAFIGIGAETLIGKSDRELFPEMEAREFARVDSLVFASRESITHEDWYTDASGDRFFMSTKKTLIEFPDGRHYLVGIARDHTQLYATRRELEAHREHLEEVVAARTRELTESRDRLLAEIEKRRSAQDAKDQAERELRHKQRLDEMGQIAGGVAHDFNNLLSVIGANLEYLKDEATGDALEASEDALEATHKAADLSKQLLAFSRKQPLTRTPTRISQIVARMERLMSRVLGEHVRLRISSDDSRDVLADPAMLEQIFLNLIINARDAMPNGGLIRVEVADHDEAEDNDEREAGLYVRVRVSDEGEGMSQETLERVFEPFFTTKDVGRGTGLGLSTVYGIVEQHNGTIQFESEIGVGTTCTLTFPRATTVATAVSVYPPAVTVGGVERILLVEDDLAVARISARILRDHGYVVFVAHDGKHALELAALHANSLDLLMSDIRMPGMDGRELAKSVCAVVPGLRVLFMTGYAEELHGSVDVTIVAKPFSRAVLVEAVRRTLDAIVVRAGEAVGLAG